LVEKRQAVEKAKLKSIENDTNSSLEKLKEEYKTISTFQSSFSYVAIITVVVMIFTIISIDLCIMVSYLRRHSINRRSKKLSKKVERSEDQDRSYKDRRSFIRNIDKRVLNFEIRKKP
jgi:cell division protein FtsL